MRKPEPVVRRYYCCKLRGVHHCTFYEKTQNITCLSFCNVLIISLLVLPIVFYIKAKNEYARSQDMLTSISNTTSWQANIAACVNSSSSYLSCDLVKTSPALIKNNPHCINNKNEVCNISVSYSISFKFTRGFHYDLGVKEITSYSITCSLPNYLSCYLSLKSKVDWVGEIAYKRSNVNVYYRYTVDPNFYTYVIIITIIVALSII